MKRKVCVVTGSRAEYGLLRRVMEEIRNSPDLHLQVAVTGMHLAPEFGLTYKEIENDGFVIDKKIDVLGSGNDASDITKAVAAGMRGFADALMELDPQIVVLLGDRFEILAAAEAAFFAGIPIAHISGGEVTEGALDDTIRHCITKMSRYHFVAAEEYRRRAIQLGEQPDTVFNVGDPALDNISALEAIPRDEFLAEVGLPTDREYFLVTFHPTTTGASDSRGVIEQLFGALDDFPQYAILLTGANADLGGRALNQLAEGYALRNPDRVRLVSSLGSTRYLTAMKYAAAVIGNSSSGIVEAPALHVPSVNIGRRQTGRLKADSIIDCDETTASISSAIRRAVSPEHRVVTSNAVSLYGDCDASLKIVAKLREADVSRFHAKVFFDAT